MIELATYSSRELANAVGKPHGNVYTLIERMVSRGEVKAKINSYQNKPGGGTFKEFQLSKRAVGTVVSRWDADAKQAWQKYVEGDQPMREVPPVPGRVAEVAQALVPEGPTLTMSSLEIAKLTGKRHDHVLRDIRTMLERLEIAGPHLWGTAIVPGPNNSKRQVEVAQLSRPLTETLITGYDVKLRHAVVLRLRQLEEQATKPAFNVPTSFAEALRLAGELEEQRVALTHQVEVQAVQIAQDAPKVQVFKKLVDQKGVITFQKFCTQLNLHQRKVKQWLRDIGWLRADQWEVNPLPTAKAVDAGYCDIKRFETEFGKLKQQIVFTSKAEAYVELKAPDYIRKPVRKSKQAA